MERHGAAQDTARDAAFTRHVLPEVEMLLRVATTLTAQPADAEDLVQDTLLRAYRAVDRFDGRHPRAWLLTILRRTEMNRNRARRPHLVRDAATELERPTAGPEEIVMDGEFDTAVHNALLTLPAHHRRVVELVDVHGLSYAEAARVLDVPEGTVMSRLHRARNRIRKRLRDGGSTPPGGGSR
ncbi:RNA polymerase sigma factor [Streptomyces calidiresistens]|nr:sigma-70 family RNA polymerase sigma factor [Streptomyces calidiresistens]